jgi:hypothetical protein
MDQTSFLTGFAVGVVTTLLTGFVFNQMLRSWRQVGNPPPVVRAGKPVTPSPLQALGASFKALFYLAVWAFLLFTIVVLAYGILTGELRLG